MPREATTAFALPLTAVQVEMLTYVLEQAAMGEMSARWAGAARRLKTTLLSADPDPKVRRVLDVSTGHLTAAERQRLGDGELFNQTMTSKYGGLVYLSEFDTPDARSDDITDTLWAIVEHAAIRGCAYILFDSDGPPLPGFRIFQSDSED